MKFQWLLGAALLFFAACAAPTGTPFHLAGSKWTLTNLTQNGTMQSPVAGTNVTLEFGENGQVSGNGGCNSFGGTYETTGEILTVRSLMSTLRACADPQAMNVESAYLAGLQGAQLFQQTADHLTITFANGNGKLEFVRR